MPRILVLDIETQRGVVETWDLFPNYIPIDSVIVPKRILCFAAKWAGQKKVMFHAAWEDDDVDAYCAMVAAAHDLLSEADVVVTWNGDRFDLHHFNAAFERLELGPPAPYRSLDLIKTVKKHFKHGELSSKLDWYAWQYLGERKTNHGGTDLWRDIRYGTEAEKLRAQRIMTKYNKQDVVLTEKLFDRFRPWTGVNFAIFEPDLDENGRLKKCSHCLSENIESRGWAPALTYAHQRFFCRDCKGWSKGRKMVYSTELRPV